MRLVKLRSIDVNLLVALDALLDERSVTRAAERMGVSQSAMSRTLARLRDLLGDPLLVRTPKGMDRTTVAEDLRRPLSEALGKLDALVTERTTFEPGSATRTFRVEMTDHAAVAVLPRLVPRLLEQAPGIDLELAPRDGDAEQRLQERQIELFVGARIQERPGLFRQILFEEHFVCVIRADHPARDRLHELPCYTALNHVLISPRGSDRGSLVDDALAEQGLHRRVVLRVPHFLVAPLVVASTDLVATVPARVAGALAAAIGLVAVRPPMEVARFTVAQVWHERNHHDHGHRWLRQTVAEVMHGGSSG